MKAKSIPYLSTEQAARLLGMTPRYVRMLCVAGKIAGAFKLGRNWAVPNPPTVMRDDDYPS
jgi:excisionase family DNA binding protein